jgi:predicted TPR repeat methyltransferase
LGGGSCVPGDVRRPEVGSIALPRPFSKAYARIYDLLYAEKDYEAESRLLDELFRAWKGGVRSVLDLGCGTGGHAARLAREGST